MMASVHDAASGNERGPERRHKDNERLPDLALGIEYVKLGGQVDGEIEKATEGD